jgi:hypothetical protein
MWQKIALGASVALVLVGTAVTWTAQRSWDATTAALRQRLLAAAAPQSAPVFTPAQLDPLPAPVARYLRTALREGQAIPRRVRVTWTGEFNMGRPGADRWLPFTAVQDFVPGAPGFVWDARMRIAPGIAVHVRDSFVGGRGAMLGKALALLTVVDREDGGDFAVAALQRYLGETIWLPTALLPGQGVHWEALDAQRARASIRAGAATASLEFSFDADGRVVAILAAQRSYDDGKHPQRLLPWRARVLRHGAIGGVGVPVEATVEWLFPEGAFAYWRGRPVAIDDDPLDRE